MTRAEKRQAARAAKLKEKQGTHVINTIREVDDGKGRLYSQYATQELHQYALPLSPRKDKVNRFKSISLKNGVLIVRTHKKGRINALVTAPIRNLKVA